MKILKRHLLLQFLNIGIDSDIIVEELNCHPDYPSLLAISDMLSNFNIENFAFSIAEEEIDQVTCPFLAHTNFNNGAFMVVSNVTDEVIILTGGKWVNHHVKRSEFKKKFKSIVLVAESREPITQKTKFSFKKLLAPQFALAALFLILCIALYNIEFFQAASWRTILLTFLKSIGLFTSVLLLTQSIDKNNLLVQIVCGGGGKTNCNAILSSKAAKVVEGLSWSEIVFFYFSGTWLLVLFGGGSKDIVLILGVFNFSSLPSTLYSIYHQARVARQWCILCCTVQSILWLEFFPLLFFAHQHVFLVSTWKEIVTIFICLFTPVCVWLLIKRLLLKVQQLQLLKKQLRKYKYNTGLFNTLLNDQPKYNNPDEQWSIVLGSTSPNNIITIVSNPYCPPCSKTHALLDSSLTENRQLQARVIFTATNDEKDNKTRVTRHLMALNQLPDKAIIKKSLHDWYEQKQKNMKLGLRFTHLPYKADDNRT